MLTDNPIGGADDARGNLGVDTGNGSLDTNFEDTELTMASKGVLVVVSHGLRVGNGATSTMIKLGWKNEGSGTMANVGTMVELTPPKLDT